MSKIINMLNTINMINTKTMNLSFINLQLLISVSNALHGICAERALHGDCNVVFTAQEIYDRVDKETGREWAASCKGSDYETRVKFLVKEIAEYGVVEQIAPGVYLADPDVVDEFQCAVLNELCSRYLVIESGFCRDGSIRRNKFTAYWEDTDDTFFLSPDDLEKASMLYAEMYDINDLLI